MGSMGSRQGEIKVIIPSKNEIIYHPASSRQPFVVDSKNPIEPGYYDISFKYSLADGVIRECKLDSAFRIKAI